MMQCWSLPVLSSHIVQQSHDPLLGATGGKCPYGWRTLAPCRAPTVAPVFLLVHAHVLGQRMRLWSPSQHWAALWQFLGAQKCRGVERTDLHIAKEQSPFPSGCARYNQAQALWAMDNCRHNCMALVRAEGGFPWSVLFKTGCQA